MIWNWTLRRFSIESSTSGKPGLAGETPTSKSKEEFVEDRRIGGTRERALDILLGMESRTRWWKRLSWGREGWVVSSSKKDMAVVGRL